MASEVRLVVGQSATPSVSPSAAPQCLYVADLMLTNTDYSISTDGRLLLYDGAGEPLTNASAVPTAVAVDRKREMLYVASLNSVQRFNIARNLSQSNALCSCSIAEEVSTIRSMAVDERDGGLYVSMRQRICHFYPDQQSISGCDSFESVLGSAVITHLVMDSGRNLLYAVPSDRLAILVFSIVSSTKVELKAQWTPLMPANPYDYSYLGLALGGNGNLFANLDPFNNTVLIEMDLDNDGSLVARYVVSDEELAYIFDFYDLTYNSDTGLFYSFFSYYNISSIASYNLVSSVNNTFASTNTTLFTTSPPKSPLALQWGRCPYLGSPSPSPSYNPSGGSDTKRDITISFSVAAPFGVIFLLIICCGPAIWIYVWSRRRRYYTGRGRATSQGDAVDVEMSPATEAFTYREVDYADLTLGRELGHGAFGRVYRGEYRGAVVAVKMFEGVRLDEAEEHTIRELRKEAEMLEKLSNHPCIVKFVGAITQAKGGATSFALVTEYCCRGSLYDLLIRKSKKLPLITLVRMARDVASGILHLHKEHVMHRDIAARNILVGKNYEVYVADFGLARTKAVESRVATTKQSFGPIAWMAPEALGNLEYSEATDAYSFGVLLWEMMARKRPWAGMEGAHIVSSVASNMRPQIPKDCDPMFKQIIKKCWKHNPSKRPSFEAIVKSLTAYHKNLKKVMSFTSDSVGESDEEVSESSVSEDELDAYEGEDGNDPRSRRMKGEIKSVLHQLLAERSDDGFETIERVTLTVLDEIKASLARLNERFDTSSAPFAAVPECDGERPHIKHVVHSSYTEVSTPPQRRANEKKKGSKKKTGKKVTTTKKKQAREGEPSDVSDEWAVLEQPRLHSATTSESDATGTGSDSETNDDYVTV